MRTGFHRGTCVVTCLALTTLLLIPSPPAAAATPPAQPGAEGRPGGADIPELTWQERSDWVNVKTAAQPPAKGDGMADDTAAIQSALDRLADGVTVYFPPGTYRITRTLVCPPRRSPGASLIGHGRSTVLAWDGEVGGRMFWTNEGMLYCRFVGLTWDGRGKAAVGFDHSAQKVFETEIRHEHEAYRNFTEAGIRAGWNKKVATAETHYTNCLFEHCGRGIALHGFNVLDHTIDGCEFRDCGVAVYGDKGTNCYVRDCHFDRSGEADVVCRGEQGSSLRRCTSQGSKALLSYGSSVGPIVVQDCQVEGWTDPAGAVLLNGAPALVFDCVFTRPPAGAEAAVRTGRTGQRLIVSNNRAEGCPAVVRTPAGGKVVEVPAGERGGSLRSAGRRFLQSSARVPSKVFDAKRDFGAKGDGEADDADAVQKTIDAARAHGGGAIAYLPTGKYAIRRTLTLSGSDYVLGGSGFRAALVWKGPAGGTTLEVKDPDRITIENLVVGHHDAGGSPNAADIVQSGSGKGSSIRYDRVWVWGMYQKKPLERGLRLVNLGPRDRVYFREVNGNLHFTDAAAGTVYAGLSYEGSIVVEGKSRDRGGFLGGGVRLATVTDPALWVKDNQSLVMSDFYSESSLHILRLEGSGDLPPGRVTLQGPKWEVTKPENVAAEIDNYRGDLVLGPYQFYVGNPLHHFAQHGDAPFTLTLFGALFYNSRPDFRLGPSAKLGVVGVDSVGLEGGEAVAGTGAAGGVADVGEAEAVPKIVKALDDLRRLGAVDLEMAHSESP